MIEIRQEMLVWMNEHYGMDPKKRMAKLMEEVKELQEAIEKGDEDEIREELADCMPPLLHLICLYQQLPQVLINAEIQMMLCGVYSKMLNRAKDPDWKRRHKHIRTEGDEV